MDEGRGLAASRRLLSLAEKFRDKQYRDSYVASHTRGILAQQMRNFRGALSQAEYAEKIGKQKTVVGRLENPGYAGWSLRTMLEIARKENIAVLVRFVDFPTFLGFTNDFSKKALHPDAYDPAEVDIFVNYQTQELVDYPAVGLSMAVRQPGYSDLFFGSNMIAQSEAPVLPLSGVSPGPVITSFSSPSISNILKSAKSEIHKLNGIIDEQKKTIQELQARVRSLEGMHVAALPFTLSQETTIPMTAQRVVANKNIPEWQLQA